MKRIKYFICFFITIQIMTLFVGVDNNSSSIAKSNKEFKLSHSVVYGISRGARYPSIKAKGVSSFTNITWIIKNKKIADIVYVNKNSGANAYTKKIVLPAYQPCYINPKTPGTTWILAKAGGNKTVKCKLHVVEKGDAIGYYVNKGRNLYGITKEEKKASKVLKKAIANIKAKNKTRVDIIKAVNDYISKTTKYDYEHYNSQDYEAYDGTVSGPLIYHKAVCEGYSVTFDAFMYCLSIPSKIITGVSYNGINQREYANSQDSNHAWNLVKMDDGSWYHIDVTWNDDDNNHYENEGVGYRYFLLRDDDISKTRTWTKSSFPQCEGEKYADYRDVLNRRVIAQRLPGYVVLSSRTEALDYLVSMGLNRTIHLPIVYRDDSWLSETEYNQIKNKVGTHMYFWWDACGTIMDEYKWYNYTITY